MATFEELGSCYRVLRYCKQQDIRFPRRHVSRSAHGDILWCQPSESAIRAIITNPPMQGLRPRPADEQSHASTTRTTDPRDGAPPDGRVALYHPRCYPAYISWAQYLANQARLQENAQRYTEQGCLGPGAREGAALLQGLATCGLCGHRMRVAYRPRPRYV